MKQHISAFAAGLLFGLGLAISQMINPEKVLAFLDVTGDWDASLLLVMGSGVTVTLISYWLIMRCDQPLFEPRFQLPDRKQIDAKLLGGAFIFGLGWGSAGYCPGPAIAALTLAYWEPIIFIAAFLVGSFSYKWLFGR